MRLERLTRLAVDPFNPADLETHLRLTSDMTFEAASLADAATRELEEHASIAIFNQSIRLTVEGLPGAQWLALPIAPYLDGAALTVTVAGQPFTTFDVITGNRPALRLVDPPEGEVIITYTAGFGNTLASVPADLRHVILDQAAVNFDLRGDAQAKGTGMSPHMARVAARYRRVAV